LSIYEKVKISDIAKHFGITNKMVIEILSKHGEAPRSASKVLTEEELNLIFDSVTLSNQVSDISEALAATKPPTPAKTPAAKTPEKAAAPAAAKKAASTAVITPAATGSAAAGSDAATGSAAQPAAGQTEAPSRAPQFPRQRERRYVDTRGSSVDLSKYDERIDALVPEKAPHIKAGKEKIKRSPGRRQNTMGQKRRQEEQDKIRRLQQEIKKKVPLKVMIPDQIAVGELAVRLKKTGAEVVKQLMKLGVMASLSEIIDFDTASLVALEFGAKVEHEVQLTIEERLIDDSEDDDSVKEPRDPVVVVMGHVDHGKTSLLDRIRNASVAAGEVGGITQHIGAYQIGVDGKQITFLDTPGHAAFTSMRARGAAVTDIAVLVVAADDGIMPQTVEAINHAKAADVPIIVAINKMDKPEANPDQIIQQMTMYDLVPEEWGGDTIVCKISAKTGEGIDNLLEMVLLVAEMRELKANPNRDASGVVIEAQLDKNRGPVATLLVKNGTLRQGDLIIAGTGVGRVRVMLDSRGRKIAKAGPSVPVEVTGLDETPGAGDAFNAVKDERMARELVAERKQTAKDERVGAATQKMTLQDLFHQIQEGQVKELNVIIKADVQGSAEAVRTSLEKLSTDEVRVKVIHAGVGGITENDVMLASASNAIVVGFNVRPESNARILAEQDKIDLRMYRVIYECIEEIQAAMKGLLAPKLKEEFLGTAEIRQVFKVSGVGAIAGCMVKEGKIVRNAKIRLVRDGVVQYEGELASLRRFKDDVREVLSGFECGIGIEKYNDVKEGDLIEAYQIVEVAQ
jgi:translation initiation factor IF-2